MPLPCNGRVIAVMRRLFQSCVAQSSTCAVCCARVGGGCLSHLTCNLARALCPVLVGWAVAAAQTYLIVEPLQVIHSHSPPAARACTPSLLHPMPTHHPCTPSLHPIPAPHPCTPCLQSMPAAHPCIACHLELPSRLSFDLCYVLLCAHSGLHAHLHALSFSRRYLRRALLPKGSLGVQRAFLTLKA